VLLISYLVNVNLRVYLIQLVRSFQVLRFSRLELYVLLCLRLSALGRVECESFSNVSTNHTVTVITGNDFRSHFGNTFLALALDSMMDVKL
jgi:hypothetical protein